MAKSKFAKEAQNIRKQSARRKARLAKIAQSAKATANMRDWAASQIKAIERAENKSRLINKVNGKTFRHTVEQAKQGLEQLKREIHRVPALIRARGNNEKVVTQQLSLASAKRASSYTYGESKVFWRVTEKIWRGEPKGNRMQSIIDYVNNIRKENKLAPLTLEEIVSSILKRNEKELSMYEKMVAQMDEEDAENSSEDVGYQELSGADNSDGEKPSPPPGSNAAVNAVRDALEDLFAMPNPLEM